MSNTNVIHRWKRLALEERVIQRPDGCKTVETIVHHPGAVLIVPVLENGDLVMVRQYRSAIDDWIYEFPAGTLEESETAEVCAKRELAEETQLVAKTWTKLGVIFPAPGFCDEEMHIFLASDLSDGSGIPDEDEFIDVISLSIDDIDKMLLDNTLKDSKTISALYLTKKHRLL
ncbi:NUDIX hydrolase [Veronia pacifica]|uniref:GDP-mannose pyrophosphatase n=1 Tax=Veronia pacifica TaxID=1080227 RepID=A0A1C3EKM7_9GAMM|nr:NUDIX hydrolase [Veronia pacifica]ODA33783.1 hypothetical protein A8L45_09135 [Veronia pacifica]